MRRELWLVTGVALTLLGGCQLIGGFDAFQGSGGASGTGGKTSTTSSSSGSSSSGMCMAGSMPGTDGRTMVLQSRTGGCFWIDVKEVTTNDYAAFLNSSPAPDPTHQTTECSGNTSFAPKCAGDAGPLPPHDPQVCVNWCDAKAYCDWAGKRLCLGDGAFNPKDASKSEWFAACSNDGPNNYPYGADFNPNACNGYDNSTTGCKPPGTCALVEAGTLSGCHTSNGVFDLSGNAGEWADECDSTGAAANCNVRGGDPTGDSTAVSCSGATPAPRLSTNRFTGFRCCAAP